MSKISRVEPLIFAESSFRNILFDLARGVAIRFVPWRLSTGHAFRYACFGVGLAITATIASAQGGQSFTGHVLDSTGAVIPAAQVVIRNQATDVETKTVTTSAGDYTVPFVIPGTYTITVQKDGFEAVKKVDILLNVDQTSTINFKLLPGKITETVTVDGSAAQIDLSKADRGEVIDAERISETALDGRNVFDLFSLSPGAHDFSQKQFGREFDATTENDYANGSPQPTDLTIDGVTNDAGGVGGAAGIVPSLDVVREFKVVLNGYDASFSHGGGNSLDVALKAGGNTFHGVADYFIRRAALDTLPYQTKYFNAVSGTPIVKPGHSRDQYSIEADGPIIIPHLYNGKDKLFYLISYENTVDISPQNAYFTYSLPSAAMIAGDFSKAQFQYNYTGKGLNPCAGGATSCLQPLVIYDPLTPLRTVVDPLDGLTKMARSPFPGNIIPANRIDPVGAAILGTYSNVSANNNPGAGYAPNTNNYSVLSVDHNTFRNALIKIDYHPSANNSLTFRYAAQGRYNVPEVPVRPSTDPANFGLFQARPNSQTGAISYTHIFSPTLLFNVGTTLITEAENKFNHGTAFGNNELQTLGFNQAYYSQTTNNNRFPDITASGLTGSLAYLPFSDLQQGVSNYYHTLQILPIVTKIRGAHSIRAGVDIRFTQNDNPIGGNNDVFAFTNNFTQEYYTGAANGVEAPGYTSGSSIASLLLGYPNSGTVTNNIHSFFSQHYIAPWAQDDWKVTKQLTLNFGLRWDFNSPVVERHDKVTSAFNPTVVNPVSNSLPAGSTALGTRTILQGGLMYAGVNGQPRAAYAMNLLQVQPRIGFAYSFRDRMSLRGGVGANFLNDASANGADGFSANTSYTASNNNNLTPYTATTGMGFSDPIPSVTQPTGSSLGLLQDLGKAITFQNPNLHIAEIWNYSIEYQAQLTKRDVIAIAYVGNRLPNQPVTLNLNLTSPQYNAQCDLERGGNHNNCDVAANGQIANPFLGVAGFKGTSYYTNSTLSKSIFLQPFPQFGAINEAGALNTGRTWYNSLQITASHTMSRSLSLHAAYTKARSESAGFYTDQLNNVISRTVSTTNDIANAVSISGVAYLPFGRGRRFLSHANHLLDAAVNGFEVSPLYTWYSGFPWRPSGNWEMLAGGGPINQTLGVAHTTLAPDGAHANHRIRGATPCVGSKDINYGLPGSTAPQVDISASATSEAACTDTPFVTAPTYAVGRNNIDFGIRQPGAYQLNIAASKNFHIPGATKVYLSEATNLRLTVDFLNAFNHPTFDVAYNNIGRDFGTINKGPTGPSNLPRYLQLSAKLNW